MEDTLHALGGILLRAIPTVFLVVLLHFYLKYTFFKPLKRVLDARYEATEGARKRAEETLSKAAAKAGEYEEALRAARAEIYQAQEQFHRRLQQQHAAELDSARAGAEAMIQQARAQLAGDVAEARVALSRDTDTLADQIANAILDRRPV